MGSKIRESDLSNVAADIRPSSHISPPPTKKNYINII